MEYGVRTIAGEIVTVASESDLDDGETTVSKIILKDMGGVQFTQSLKLAKTYAFEGDGVVSVAEGVAVEDPGSSGSRPCLLEAAEGHVFYKRGKGVLKVGRPSSTPTQSLRIVVEGGTIQNQASNFFGKHWANVDSIVVDVREGAVYDYGTQYSTVGALELTGGTFLACNTNLTSSTRWINPALMGGVIAHACATPSRITFPAPGTLGNLDKTNSVFLVEAGAELILDAMLNDGYAEDGRTTVPGTLTKDGEGTLILLRAAGWTGGSVLKAGTVVLGSQGALGEPVTLEGDVTLEALAGETIEITNLNLGTVPLATVTLKGDGAFTLPNLPEGVTLDDQTTRSATAAVDGSTLRLSGGAMVVDVPEGETLEITQIESVGALAAESEIVKTGLGDLVLPTGLEAHYGRLTVQGGFVVVTNESSFGAGLVTLTNGGGLRIPGSVEQKRTVVLCKGTGALDIPETGTFTIRDTLFKYREATVVKTGAGLWKMATNFQDESGNYRAKWIVDEGVLESSGGDSFSKNYATKPVLTLEVHENGLLRTARYNQHFALGDVILRGGTLFAGYAQFNGDPSKISTSTVEGGNVWKAFGLNGTLTVNASTNGQPSRICARTASAGHLTFETIFDVKKDAVLEVDALINPGRAPTSQNMTTNVVTKKGLGRLKLTKGLGIIGTFQIKEGDVEFGEGATLSDCATLAVDKNARLILDDRARLETHWTPSANGLRVDVADHGAATFILMPTNTSSTTSFPLVKGGTGTLWLGGALTNGAAVQVNAGTLRFTDGRTPSRVPVWMDAADASTVALQADGVTVDTVANKGSSGGRFRLNATNGATAPQLKTDAINGLSALSFVRGANGDDKAQALMLDSYTNTTSPRTLSIYAVMKRTKFHAYGGSFSLSSQTANQSDERFPGAVHEEATKYDQNKVKYFFGNGNMVTKEVYNQPMTNDVFIRVVHCTSNGWFVAWETNSIAMGQVPRVACNDVDYAPLEINLVNLGARLNKNGVTRDGWTGEIGEFIVTTMPLAEDEEVSLLAYLRKKWMDKGDGPATPPDWLVGNAATPATDTATQLAFAEGTGLSMETAQPLALGALTTEGTCDWTRLWPGTSADDFLLFEVEGDVALQAISFSATPVPPVGAKILGWTGTATGADKWTLQGIPRLRVSRRSNGCWFTNPAFVFVIR